MNIRASDKAASHLGICVGSVHRLIREGILPATQLMPWAPWQIPVAALNSESVQAGVRAIIERRPRNMTIYQEDRTIELPGFLRRLHFSRINGGGGRIGDLDAEVGLALSSAA